MSIVFLCSFENFADTLIECRLHHEILAFSAYCEHTPQELRLRQKVIDWLERIIRQQLPDARADVFGSSATGLGVPVACV